MSKTYNKNIKNLAEACKEGKNGGGASDRNMAADKITGKHSKKSLSLRENEIYELIIIGKTNREICRELCICRGTLERHISSIYRKKGVKNRFELVFKSKQQSGNK